MPRIIDHAQRRTEVVEVACSLIAKHGMDRVGIRMIANKAGYSTSLITHYFHNKNDLLLMAFEHTIDRAWRRLDEAISEGTPIQLVLETHLPIGAAGQRQWRIFFAFWHMTLSNGKYQRKQLEAVRRGVAIVRRALDQCSRIPRDVAGGREKQATSLQATVAGIATMALHDPQGWPPERQREALAFALQALGEG